jgi:hypothetical protein
MFSPLPARAHRGAALPITALFLLLLAGCAPTINGSVGTPTPSPTATIAPTATPLPKATVQQIEANITKPSVNGGTFDATATCPAGAALVSGGFADASTEGASMDVYASYPSASNAWTVTAFSVGGPLNFSAYANCITANFPVSTQIVNTNASGGGTATCPAGTTLTGGGYKGAGVATSKPSGSGWQSTVQFGAATALQLYAVCANSNLSAGSAPTASVSIPSVGDKQVQVGCPAGQSLVGGGFSSAENAAAYVSLPKADFETWIVQAKFVGKSGTSATMTVSALCVTLTPHP